MAGWTRSGVVESGVARAYLAAGGGRMLTIRYVRPGELIGSPFPIIGKRAPLGISAVTPCVILEFDIEDLRQVIASDATAANQVVDALSQRLQDTYATLAAHAFGTMAERVAGHLLDLAQPADDTKRLVARVTQQELAEAVGTAREVVARVLQEFRHDGVVATAAGSIEILQPEQLASRVGRWHFPE
ncbi:MAG: Crp/Fnr family transcriptional regulator [Chloroflexi bacterium]|nr:Crp/Fnr family transcriptional regulator [Chloroflexota bacterium]